MQHTKRAARGLGAVWARTFRECRRYLASILLGWIMWFVPDRDTNTMKAIAGLANALLEEEG